MLKMMGLVFMVLFCTGCGMMLAGRLRGRTEALGRSQLFLHLLSERLHYTLCPVGELFEALAAEPLLAQLDYIADCSRRLARGLPFPDALRQSVMESRLPLNERDRELLCALCPIVGASDIENQLQGMALVRANLAGQAEEAKAQAEKRSKLYSSLGVLSGAALAIVLL